MENWAQRAQIKQNNKNAVDVQPLSAPKANIFTWNFRYAIDIFAQPFH